MYLFCPSHSQSYHQLKTVFPASVTLLFQSLPYKHGLQGLCSGKASTCGGHLAWPLASLAFIQVILLGLSFSYKLSSYRPSHTHSSSPKSMISAPGSREANTASLLSTLAHILERLSFLLVEKGKQQEQSAPSGQWAWEVLGKWGSGSHDRETRKNCSLEPGADTTSKAHIPLNLLLPSRTDV